jgi:uncharacterized membrane protein SirB2
MYKGLLHTHLLAVILFLLLYVIKTGLLLANKSEALEKFRAKTKVPEMIISTLFLGTGVGMLFNIGEIKPLLIVKIAIVLASIPVGVIAFKKNNKGLAVLMLFLLVTAWCLAEMNKKVEKLDIEALNNATVLETGVEGKIIYDSYCKSCHGAAGDAGMSGAKNLKISTLSNDETYKQIKNGKSNMPAYGKILTEEKLKAVTDYTLTLRK